MYGLKGVIYTGDIHYRGRICVDKNVWFHYGMVTGKICKYEGKFTSGYPWSIPIRLNIFSYELSLIGTFLRWTPRDNCIGPE